jgi:hypothetical protein
MDGCCDSGQGIHHHLHVQVYSESSKRSFHGGRTLFFCKLLSTDDNVDFVVSVDADWSCIIVG